MKGDNSLTKEGICNSIEVFSSEQLYHSGEKKDSCEFHSALGEYNDFPIPLIVLQNNNIIFANKKFGNIFSLNFNPSYPINEQFLDKFGYLEIKLIENINGYSKANFKTMLDQPLTSFVGMTTIYVDNKPAQMVFLLDYIESEKKSITDETILNKEQNYEIASIQLKELHHRIKNNFQSIDSLLSLKIKYFKDEDSITLINNCRNILKTISITHEKLYCSNKLNKVNINHYISDLTTHILESHEISQIDLQLEIDNIDFNLETASPIGLIVNEALTNSIKHAFKRDSDNNKFTLTLTKEGSKIMLLLIDNGPGANDTIDIENVESLGLKIINMLVQQLQGIMEIKAENGFELRITFPYFQ